ncbi:MAG: hypothetical protein M0P57_11235 [Syntrophales bacterium]|nr:hypothetical protein [Syntrophales bacterium]MDY0044233.1 hypothetical protein [Syntrophales bacterium]
MALDEANENDTVINNEGITIVIDKSLLESVSPVTLDYIETPRGSGYSISSSLESKGCGGSCSC